MKLSIFSYYYYVFYLNLCYIVLFFHFLVHSDTPAEEIKNFVDKYKKNDITVGVKFRYMSIIVIFV